MDELDRNILTLLGADARMSVATLARRLKVARSTIQARLERLETSGIIGSIVGIASLAQESLAPQQTPPPIRAPRKDL